MGKKKTARKREAKRKNKASYLRTVDTGDTSLASPAHPDTAPTVSGARAGQKLPGGRLSIDTLFDFFGRPIVLAPPLDAEGDWRALKLDSRTLDRLTPSRLLEYLCELSPDMSRALWDFLRLCNPGYTVSVYAPGTATTDDGNRAENAKGQKIIDEFMLSLKSYYGAFDIVINRLYIGAFMRGAYLAELVLDADGYEALDIATPDPKDIRFKRSFDPVRGGVWSIGQFQQGLWVQFDRPTIKYIPVDPYPAQPYGRALVAPALFSTMFLLGMLHDLRRVIQQQGYPRIDVEVDLEQVLASMPVELQSDSAEVQKWQIAAMKDVQKIYQALEPDDSYIHAQYVKVNRPVGTLDAQALGKVDDLIKALERMSMRALKSMPLLMGTTDGVSEANANRQWEIHAAGVKSLQHLVESLFESLFTLVLNARGVQGDVVFRFAELRNAELFRDAQVDILKATVARLLYDDGYIDQNEASNIAVGHDADQPEPRVVNPGLAHVPGQPPSGQLPADQGGVDPGSNRWNPLRGMSRSIADEVQKGIRQALGIRSVAFTPEGANDPLPGLPDDATPTDADKKRAIKLWDRLMPNFAGLLAAKVVNQTDFDGVQH
jgi:hypothetical protein